MVLNQETSFTASTFITFIIVFSQILSPAKAISAAFSNIQRGLASGRRIFKVIDTTSTIKDPEQPIQVNSFERSIRFDRVGFSYIEGDPVLHEISFEIPKGKTIALVGPSGSGKSTLFDMIPRFIDPKKGKILMDGINYKDISKENLREFI